MQKVDNDLYHELGEKWYLAHDDPIALLRAESRLRNPWVVEKLESHLGSSLEKTETHILDVGCGGGFLSNYLALQGYHIRSWNMCTVGLP